MPMPDKGIRKKEKEEDIQTADRSNSSTCSKYFENLQAGHHSHLLLFQF
jgi:hypothetical protein